MTIKSIQIVRDATGPDYVYLKTDLPQGMWPYLGTAQLKLEVAADSAEEYCTANFPDIEVEVIDISVLKNKQGKLK